MCVSKRKSRAALCRLGVVHTRPQARPRTDVHVRVAGTAMSRHTVARNCTVEGRGLTAATVRTAATFVIHAFDNQGLERKVGGDAFFVSIHGRGVRVRARVVDEQDGSYTVRYLCTQSGTYWINISLYGETLPGSPFMCQASRQTAMAPNCKVTGAALTTAIARVQQVFEIQFRDMHDDVAHAEELDVYVEPILKHEPSHEEIRDETAGEDALGPDLSSGVDAMAAANPPPGDSVGSISAAAGKRPGSPNVTRSGEASPGRPASSPKVRSTSPGASQPASPSLRPSSPPSIVDTMVDAAAGLAKALGMSEASSAPEPLSSDQQRGSAHEGTNDPSVGGSLKTNHRSSEPSKPNPFLKSKPPVVPKLQLTECVVTSKSPLIIRAGIEMESARIGQLRPGRKVNVLQIVEPQDPNSGESARACIMLDDEEEPHRAEHEAVKQQSWREAYPERPGWWDDMGLGSPRSPRSYRQQVPLGWVTLAKEGRKLVTPRTHLAAGARQQHIQAWARRKAVDSSLAATALQKNKPKGDEHVGRDAVGQRRKKPVVSVGKQDNGLFINELKSDPNGIGFAYGGVEPGRLHAHGQPVQTHKVYYSIAICGEYKLHVGLRQQEIPVPGSPFTLTVLAGQAHSLSTTLPSSMLPLRGVVGFGEGQGCRHTLQVMDKMGNKCTAGGAKVECLSDSGKVTSKCTDNGDGTYLLEWNSNDAGTFKASVTIDGILIKGTPAPLRLASGTPSLAKTVLEGDGLSSVHAGKNSICIIKLLDEHSNVAIAPPTFRFGMTLARSGDKEEKDKWKTAPSYEFQGEWIEDEYHINYCIKAAGDLDLTLWCFDKATSGPRTALPGSPFKVTCVAGRPNSAGSFIDGFSKEEKQASADQSGKKAGGGKPVAPAPQAPSLETAQSAVVDKVVGAGEQILFRPQIRDPYGNSAAAPSGALLIEVTSPDGNRLPLPAAVQVRGGLTTYESRFEPKQCGSYVVHVELFGSPITGAPVHITCVAAVPDVSKSQFSVPEPPLFQNDNYDVILRAVDKYGNACTRGGATIVGRLQCAAMPHGQDSNVPVTDNGDGTYALHVCLVAPADIKLITAIQTGKEKSEKSGTEFPQINMNFQSNKARDAVKKAESNLMNAVNDGASRDKGGKSFKKGAATAKLQAAAKEIMSAMGDKDERRPKVMQAEEVVQMAVDTFVQAGESASTGADGGDSTPKTPPAGALTPNTPKSTEGSSTPKSQKSTDGNQTPKTPKSARTGTKMASSVERKEGSFLSSGTTGELGGNTSVVDSSGSSTPQSKTPRTPKSPRSSKGKKSPRT